MSNNFFLSMDISGNILNDNGRISMQTDDLDRDGRDTVAAFQVGRCYCYDYCVNDSETVRVMIMRQLHDK